MRLPYYPAIKAKVAGWGTILIILVIRGSHNCTSRNTPLCELFELSQVNLTHYDNIIAHIVENEGHWCTRFKKFTRGTFLHKVTGDKVLNIG